MTFPATGIFASAAARSSAFVRCPTTSFFFGEGASAARAASNVLRSADSADSAMVAMSVWDTDRSPGPPIGILPRGEATSAAGPRILPEAVKMRLLLRPAPPQAPERPPFGGVGMAGPGVLTAAGASPSEAATTIARLAPNRDELMRWYALMHLGRL